MSVAWVRANKTTLEIRKEIKMKGLVLPNLLGNQPAYIKVKMLRNLARADITPKSKSEPCKQSTKYNGIIVGNIPKTMP